MAIQTIESEPNVLDEIRQPHVSDPRWEAEAECRLMVANDFLGGEVKSSSATTLKPAEAYQIAAFCGQCSVRSDCLAAALITQVNLPRKSDKEYGVRGGLSQGQRIPLLKMMKSQGFIDAETWEKEIARADDVRKRYLAGPPREWRPEEIRRRYVSESAARDKLETFLASQPDATFPVPQNGSVYKGLAEAVGVSPIRIRKLVINLAHLGVVEKSIAEKGGKITAVRLVS